ncbi:MAG TPA: DUF222 domain-containing protein [Actinomycetales bacterium]|nr:DUF222 domain-containing protein [Actinomycetales bacterium]
MSTAAGCATDLLEAIADISRAAEVAGGGWDRLSPGQRDDAYRELERARKKLAVVDAEYLRARRDGSPIADSRIPGALARSQRISRAEARRRRAAFRRLSPGHAGLGSKGNAEYMPCLRRKVEEGVVGADAVEKIDKVLRGFPEKIHGELTRVADPHIAELVEHVDVDDLDQLAPMLRALFGIDDPYTDADRKRARGVRVGAQEHDGMSRITGRLTPHLAALIKRLAADHAGPGDLLAEGAEDPRNPNQRLHDALEAALAAGFGRGAAPAGEGWAEPGADSADSTGPTGSAGSSRPTGPAGHNGPGVGPDPIVDPDFGANADTFIDDLAAESAEAAEAEASKAAAAEMKAGIDGETTASSETSEAAEAVEAAEAADTAGTVGTGTFPRRRRGKLQPARGTTSVVVVARIDQLMAMTGTISTDTNVRMSVAEAIENADARNLFLQVMDFRGRTLYFGRSRRRGSMDQYLALFGEEGMSSAPGSSAPAAWCHMHHTTGWQHGGNTDLDDLTLVDAKTHANVDDSRRNPNKWWTRKGVGPDEPRVVWVPPASADPERKPAENQHPAAWDNPGRTIRRDMRRPS